MSSLSQENSRFSVPCTNEKWQGSVTSVKGWSCTSSVDTEKVKEEIKLVKYLGRPVNAVPGRV